MNNERRDELDSVLDAALRDYSNRAPRAGFERRILARIQSTPPMPRSSAWIGRMLALALASLAAIVLAAIVLTVPTSGHRGPEPKPLPRVARAAQPPIQPSPPAPVRKAAKGIGTRGKLPEMERFPEPEPLTAGERALLHFVRIEPEQARELFASSPQMKDLTIDPLKIEALP